MDAQMIFNTVATHLLTQGCQSLKPNGNCAYRGENGTKCAVGVLISNRNYRKWMDGDRGVSANHLVAGLDGNGDFHPTPKAVLTLAPHVDLLGRLQSIHDADYNWRDDDLGLLKDQLRETARQYGLNADVVPV